MTPERDLAAPMHDGVRLFANLYKPAATGSHPVIISVTPYSKDRHPDRVAHFFMHLSGVKFGKLNCSRLTGFESPDPIYWVQQGDAVLHADVRTLDSESTCRVGPTTPRRSVIAVCMMQGDRPSRVPPF